jgi:threonine dehydratase
MTTQDVANALTTPPTPVDLLRARSFVAAHYLRTPLYPATALSQEYACDLFVKYENHGPIRSFKARGALYRLSLLDEEQRCRGVVTASTGNHGQGVAFAGKVLKVPTTIVVPQNAPRIKTDNIRFLGGDLRIVGTSLAEAEMEARTISDREGKILIEDGDDSGLMAGAGTVAWEILDQLPDSSAIVVPVGGGNLIAGIALVAKCLKPAIRIIGVQSEAAPSVYQSWKDKRMIEAPSRTFAGGLATSHPGRLAFSVFRNLVDLMVLVSEEELREGILTVLRTTGQIAEGAGAAVFAGLKPLRSELSRLKTVLVLSGGNLPFEDLRQLMLLDDNALQTGRE